MLKGFLGLLFSLSLFLTGHVGSVMYMDSMSYATPRAYVEKLYQVDGGSGSAIVIAPGLVLTAAHVAVNKDLLINGKPTKTLKIDHSVDLALVAAEVDCPCAPLGLTGDLGDKVVAVGYSLGMMEYATPGTIQGWGDGRVWSDSAIAPGNSGGGIFSYQRGQWRLVGVTVQVAGMSNGFFGIPVMHMTRSVDILKVKEFIGYDLESQQAY